MKRYNIINEDFFDNFNDEDNDELTKEEIIPSYENILSICHYIPSNKKLLGRKSIDIIPLVRIIKQFFSIIQTLRFVGEYNVKIWFLGIDLLKSEVLNNHKVEELVIEIDNDRITEKDYLKNICYKLYDIYEETEELKGTMNISLTIQMNFESVLVPFMTFVNDYRKLQRYGISVSKLGCLSGLGTNEPTMNFYKGGVKSGPLWKVDSDNFDRITLSSVWNLAIEIFGNDNKYYNTEEKNKLFSDGKSNNMYSSVLDLSCPNFLKKMALYFKRKREHYLCDIIGYNHKDGAVNVVVYLDTKDYDSITVKNIVDYMKELIDKFNIYKYSELKELGYRLYIWVSCYELPEKRSGKKAESFDVSLSDQYYFPVYIKIVDNESGEYRQYHDSGHILYERDPFRIMKSVINPAIKNFKTIENEISKIK